MKDSNGSKVLSLQEAAGLIQDGDIIYTSGILGRKPIAFESEIIRQKKKNLILTNVVMYGEDLMVGADCVTGYYGCYVAMGPFGLCNNFNRAVKEGNMVVAEVGHLEMCNSLLAGAMGVPYIPSRVSLGTDIINPKYDQFSELRKLARNKDKFPVDNKITMEDPFWGGKNVLTPALKPDVAIIHAQYAGPDGTVRITGPLASDVDAARAADMVIVTCEQIVPEEWLRREPRFNTFGATEVDYVVEVPWCCHPGSLYDRYDLDPKFIREYQQASRSEEGTQKWLQEWVYDVKDHFEYLEKLGLRRLDALKVKDPVLGYRPWVEWESDML
jgi:glutaconate CoA-transferase subunit A